MLKVLKFLLYILSVLFISYINFMKLCIILIFLYTFINPPVTSLMINRNIFNHYKTKPIKFIKLKNINYEFKRLIVTTEDCNFYKHCGIDIDAIKTAYEINKRCGYDYAGGSTITQQLIRTLFLNTNKNYIRKGIEIQLSLIMNLIMSKDRQLELYLNYAEFGKGIYGIGQASNSYYGTTFYNLNEVQMTKLIAIMPSPINYNVNNFSFNYKLINRYFWIWQHIEG